MQFTVHTLSRIMDGVSAMAISAKGISIETKSVKKLYTWQSQSQPPVILNGKITPKIQVFTADASFKVRIQACDIELAQFELQKLWLSSHVNKLKQSILKLESLLEKRYLSHSLLSAAQRMTSELAQYWLTWSLDKRFEPHLGQTRFTLEEVHHWQQQDIDEFREAFIKKQLHDFEAYFDSVAAQPLTIAQRRACVVVDERQLLLAGAGTGKTSVMIAKVGYLLASKIAQSSQILMLAYGKDAADEMHQRLKYARLDATCRTFHSLGTFILTEVEGRAPVLSNMSNSEQQKRQFIHETLVSLCQDQEFKTRFLTLLKSEFKLVKSDTEIDFASPSVSRVVRLFSELIGLYKQAASVGNMQHIEGQYESVLAVFRPVLTEYQLYLSNEQSIDYDDMISRAIKYVKSGQFQSPWVHILVDEFQDISPVRAELVKVLLAQHSRSHLFAVGDDWQSIYRFSGADLTLTTHFAQHFGPSTVMQLDKTFRYGQDLLDLASDFICQNPQQIVKQVRAQSVPDEPSVLITPEVSENSFTLVIKKIAGNSARNVSVMILARYHKQLPSKEALLLLNEQYTHLNISAMTFHAAKGKEADYTILTGLDSDSVPAKRKNDELVEAFLPNLEAYPDAEERRLFYVALTRAKRQAYIMSPKKPSHFIAEISTHL
ncbi:UvrD-helicase domain-containing protein [Pseudoalteromonas sp. Of7M-16]|uniref:UvrD-helicase domain-containing protein n=1 Tax=Pseudoalteromonas sp. Of7M-16 TaxID=2917756 RepID=UPI001EF6B526|nr:UvrD-helicase domain-containing protein [Pseudoalteromonas sp. Of7M-16]MCG7548626.1 UvrD-helicase domain-containing protein [Pseudoalteromonas sp. Of7M-16]